MFDNFCGGAPPLLFLNLLMKSAASKVCGTSRPKNLGRVLLQTHIITRCYLLYSEVNPLCSLRLGA